MAEEHIYSVWWITAELRKSILPGTMPFFVPMPRTVASAQRSPGGFGARVLLRASAVLG